jgi:hypothetical protein
LPQTVTGAVTSTLVPLPDPPPLRLPDPADVAVVEPAPEPELVERAPFTHELLVLPLRTVAELPHTVTGAVAAKDVPLPDPVPLWLPLPEAAEPLDVEPCDPPLPIDTG